MGHFLFCSEPLMTTIRSFMTEDHRHCDDLLAEAEQGIAGKDLNAARLALGKFQAAILAHFEGEESTLFPAFESKTGMSTGPTMVMRMEHAQMRELLDAAVAALRSGNTEDYFGHVETLLIMMQQHNMKEENVLYPMCDQQLAGELDDLLARLGSVLAEA
jgi:DUF438 domain-containing protein